jgi:hypothetical protein
MNEKIYFTGRGVMHQSMKTYTTQTVAEKSGLSARNIFHATVNLQI